MHALATLFQLCTRFHKQIIREDLGCVITNYKERGGLHERCYFLPSRIANGRVDVLLLPPRYDGNVLIEDVIT